MKIVVLDGTAVAADGPGASAYFSRYSIAHLREAGHTVETLNAFDADKCRAADIVWAEWCNELAFQAAASGLCQRLVLRLRGYDAWFPLDKLAWSNVDLLLFESPLLQQLFADRFPAVQVKRAVLPAGIDLSRFTYKPRTAGKTLALVARAVELKGQQLMLEWARQNPTYTLHITTALGEHNPRFVRYLEYAAPANVKIHGTVDPATWLDEIDANYLVVASIWETLGYSIVEAAALGIKPLIHDMPYVRQNWPVSLLWTDFAQLNQRLIDDYDSQAYRAMAESFDADILAVELERRLIALVRTTPPRVVPHSVNPVGAFLAAVDRHDLDEAATVLQGITIPDESRAWMAFLLASGYNDIDRFTEAAMWAHLSMLNGPRVDSLCLLGEVSVGRDNLEAAVGFYETACRLRKVSAWPGTTPPPGWHDLVDGRHARLEELRNELRPALTPPTSPWRYYVMVPVRNGARWIERCVRSILEARRGYDVQIFVLDDASDDGTLAHVPVDPRVIVLQQTARVGMLRNTVEGIRRSGATATDVVVIVDGDDFLRPNAFYEIDRAYAAGAWATYGTFEMSDGRPSWMDAYPHSVVVGGRHRQHPWRGSHCKTFKRGLFDAVPDTAFKDDTGAWFMVTGDVALMIPILEMARERALHIETPIYVYNVETPDNDHKRLPQEQVQVRDAIFARAAFHRLEVF